MFLKATFLKTCVQEPLRDRLLKGKSSLVILDTCTGGLFRVPRLGSPSTGDPSASLSAQVTPPFPASVLWLTTRRLQPVCISLQMGIQAINYVPEFLKPATKVIADFLIYKICWHVQFQNQFGKSH